MVKISKPFPTFIVASLGLIGSAASAPAATWTHYLGPNYDMISRETGLEVSQMHKLWEAQVGTGFSSITSDHGHVYTMGNNGSRDVVSCLDARTGKMRWQRSYPCQLRPNMYEGGPNATPTLHDGKVYTLSKEGHIHCFNASSGKTLWSTHASDLGSSMPNWGFSGSPTVLDGKVIFNVGDGVALDADTGKVVWNQGSSNAGYASPRPFPRGSRTAVALFRGNGLAAVDPETGKDFWFHPWSTSHDVNAANPVYFDEKFFISSSYGTGCALIDVSSGSPQVLWRNKNMHNHFQSTVYHEGFLYGVDGHTGRRSRLTCIDVGTGKKLWKQELGFGNVAMADGKLFVLNEKGMLFVVRPVPDGYQEIARHTILTPKCWTAPMIVGGRLYARNAAGRLVCYGFGPAPAAPSR